MKYGFRLARRRFLIAAGSGVAVLWSDRRLAEGRNKPKIQTVLGPIASSELGPTLTHEHVMVDFIGADKVSPNRYDQEEVFRTVLPYLQQLHSQGCRTLVECTPAFLGRDVKLLARLSKTSGVRMLTNTGYYGAAADKYVPNYAFKESAEQLAQRWIAEFRKGIDETKIRPGFIKIGVDSGPLSEIDAKLVRAAAITHRSTGLTIAAHTGNGKAALEEASLLRKEKVASNAFIWVHAQNEAKTEIHIEMAGNGAWISCDGIGPDSLSRHIDLIRFLIDRGHIGNLLISQDAGWYHVGEPGGGKFRPYNFLFREFLPKLRQAGVSEEQIRMLIVDNPARALTPEIRLLRDAGAKERRVG